MRHFGFISPRLLFAENINNTDINTAFFGLRRAVVINFVPYIDEKGAKKFWRGENLLPLSDDEPAFVRKKRTEIGNFVLCFVMSIRHTHTINGLFLCYSNQIHYLSGEWSHLKSTVVTLFLGENDIIEVPPYNGHSYRNQHGLHQLKALTWLNLDGNKIQKIHKESLPQNLQTLSVSHNILQSFPAESVSVLQHLQWLYLRGNDIRSIPERGFPNKMWIEKADLAENYLKTLPRFPFNNSVYVRDLNLAFNDIKSLTADCFSGLHSGRIILSYNQLESVETNAFSGLHDSLEYLDFDHNNFLHVPHELTQLTSLKYLYLSSNFISEIPEDIFASLCPTLKALSLCGNRLTRIPSVPLQNCSKISHFNIAFNEIYDVAEGDFSWGANIRNLMLANNNVVNLKSQMFRDLGALKELSLSFNPLRYLDPDAFAGLEGLESLEISFGLDRDVLPHEMLRPLVSLQWLSLDNNNFHAIPENSFDGLTELTNLNLDSNRLRKVPRTLFKGSVHKNLKEIRLSSNELTEIRSDTFKSLNSLEAVLLANNKIRSVQTESFSRLPKIKHIIISDNLLSHISPKSFANLPVLMKLELQNNLLTQFSFAYFENFSNPLQLNLSRNQLSKCDATNMIVNLEVLDLRYNNFNKVPKCLEGVALLRRLFLDFNTIASLEHNNLMHLTSLEQLTLQQNAITYIHKKAFFGLQNLQILDLSKNLISHLHMGQFSSMPRLRILNLSNNNIKYLPKDAFSNTLLEMLDLSNNAFLVVPSISLSEVGFSLRHFSISNNNIDHIDSTTFPDIPFLQHLDLSSNKLTILPDNVFTSLSLLQKLDLSSNPARANFKELFHYAQNLKELRLSNAGMSTIPHLPLPNLVHLNLSHNNIDTINKNCLKDLKRLKYLDLSYNQLAHIPHHVWFHLPLLKSLDVSFNPIKEILATSFYGLHNLQDLKLRGLTALQKFESKALIQLKILTELSLQTWPDIDNFTAQLCSLLGNLQQLRVLRLQVEEATLDEQLLCLSNRKIRHVEVTGRNLKTIDRNAFSRLVKNPNLVLRIADTEVEELPPGVFAHMYKISYLTIDLRGNMLQYLSPEIFYGNSTTWKNVGTTLVSGEKDILFGELASYQKLNWPPSRAVSGIRILFL